jgi:phenylalanyl-tRNA synthetase beta chain
MLYYLKNIEKFKELFMKISLSLLKTYIEIDQPVEEIAKILTFAGIEVDAIENVIPNFSNIFCAAIKSVEKHPNADKLVIAKVFDGIEEIQVVCGAANCRAGIRVAYAKIGAEIKEPSSDKSFKIKKSKLRDVESFGMLCSAKELGIFDEDAGILEIEESIEIGTDLSKLFSGPVFEVSLTPNLGHCSSAIGIARELGAQINKKIKSESFKFDEIVKKTKDQIDISVKDFKMTPRYACRIIEDIDFKNAKTPNWMKAELFACGMRPISPIVDIMNYVMIDLGQPLHAFDYDKIEEKKITVDSTKEKEMFFCLDSEEREIPQNAIMINDSAGPIAIAGVMGGLHSSVTDSTTKILIEGACFDSIAIRQTANILNLRTESALRFEKGIDPNNIIDAINKATFLVQKICGGNILKDVVDIKENEFLPKKISIRISKANQILGIKLSISEIEEIFKRLEFKLLSTKEDLISLEIPTYRNDIFTEIDLIEEVARIYGYNNIPIKNPKITIPYLPDDPMYTYESKLKRILTKFGLQEIITTDLISPKLAKIIKDHSSDDLLELLHSKSIDHSVLRSSLLPSMLEVIKHNHDHKVFDVNTFEIGRVHLKDDQNIFLEKFSLGITLTGKKAPEFWENTENKNLDFFDIKAIIENLFKSLQVKEYSFSPSTNKYFHPFRQASITIDDIEIGTIGQIHPSFALKNFDLQKPIYFSEINLSSLSNFIKEFDKVKKLPTYPSTQRDWTVTVDMDENYINILEIIKKTKSILLKNVYLLNTYANEKTLKNKKNLTFRFVFRDDFKTLSFEEAEKEFSKIIENSKAQLEKILN